MLTINDYKKSTVSQSSTDADNGVKDDNNNELTTKQITLTFAYMCLKNAYNLLPSTQQIFTPTAAATASSASKLSKSLPRFDADATETTTTTTTAAGADDSMDAATQELPSPRHYAAAPHKQAPTQQLSRHKMFANCVWPSRPLNVAQLQHLRASILISLAYCALCLRDYQAAVKYASLIIDPNDALNSKCPPSNGIRYLAHSYLAEAKLYLEKITESIEHLNLNSRIETENDISFVPTSMSSLSEPEQQADGQQSSSNNSGEFLFRST